MTKLGDLVGLWRRSVITWPDGTQDNTTHVTWLQGPTCYGDLRQPRTSVRFVDVRRLRDLDATQIEVLARREGFAGTLVQHTDHFHWTRTIDFQPAQTHEDRGTLDDRGAVMIERGYEVDYVEHWHRTTSRPVEAAALTLVDTESGCAGLIVRVNDHFSLARGRTRVLAEPMPLLDYVRQAPSLEAAQDLLDCEVSIGTIGVDWLIDRSTLPYRETANVTPRLSGDRLTTADVTSEGRPYRRVWKVVAREGCRLAGG